MVAARDIVTASKDAVAARRVPDKLTPRRGLRTKANIDADLSGTGDGQGAHQATRSGD
jgi:hypothetical protein